jgi:hypothetical protein
MTTLDEMEKLLAGWKQACARTDDPLQKDVIKLKALELALGIESALPGLIESARRAERLEKLVRDMIENEPDELVADGGHTVFDEWCYYARAALKEK